MPETGSAVVTNPAGLAPATSEQELIVRAQRYEAEALAELFEAHFDELYRYVFARLGDHAAAEDLTRQVFLRALDGLPRFRRFEAGFAPWLCRIANSLLVAQARAQAPDPGDSPASLPADAPPAARLRLALRRLTPDQQEVLSLRFIAGLPAEAVATATGHRLSHVLALQHRALLGLRREMELGEES
jgi:RNA polymerase sigma-70 factor (ECF subfamily)